MFITSEVLFAPIKIYYWIINHLDPPKKFVIFYAFFFGDKFGEFDRARWLQMENKNSQRVSTSCSRSHRRERDSFGASWCRYLQKKLRDTSERGALCEWGVSQSVSLAVQSSRVTVCGPILSWLSSQSISDLAWPQPLPSTIGASTIGLTRPWSQ